MRDGIAVVGFGVACASGGWRPPTPPFEMAMVTRATGDPAAIEAMLSQSVINGGLWFTDPACDAQFGKPEEIKPDRFAAFARCLAGLHLQASPRVDEAPDVLVLTYDPGFEIEARLVDNGGRPRITWIGYESRTSEDALIPTISAAALEAHRLAGDRTGPVNGEVAKTLAPKGGVARMWLKLCVDPEGALTVQPRESTSGLAQQAFAEAASAWRFRPFVVRDRAIAVCAMVQLAYPPDRVTGTEVLPVPVPPSRSVQPPSMQSPIVMGRRRVAGDSFILPDDATKTEIQLSGRDRVMAVFKLCVDETGQVESLRPMQLTGFAAYDRKLGARLREWVFKPLIVDGKATAACTAVTFIYSRY